MHYTKKNDKDNSNDKSNVDDNYDWHDNGNSHEDADNDNNNKNNNDDKDDKDFNNGAKYFSRLLDNVSSVTCWWIKPSETLEDVVAFGQ